MLAEHYLFDLGLVRMGREREGEDLRESEEGKEGADGTQRMREGEDQRGRGGRGL